MRKSFVVLALLVAVLVGATVVGTVTLRRLVAQQREAILAAAEQAVGRRLSIGELEVHLLPIPSLHLSALRVADDPAFGDGPFLTAASARAQLRVSPLLRGRVVVSQLRVDQPVIQVIRNADGVWNVSTLGSRRAPEAAPPGPAAWFLGTALAATERTASGSRWPIATVEIRNGLVQLRDHSTQPPRQLRLADVRLRLRDLSWNQPVQVALDAGVDTDVANVHVAGAVGPLDAADGTALDLRGEAGPFGSVNSRLTDLHLLGRITADGVTVTALTGRAFDGDLRGGRGLFPACRGHDAGSGDGPHRCNRTAAPRGGPGHGAAL